MSAAAWQARERRKAWDEFLLASLIGAGVGCAFTLLWAVFNTINLLLGHL